jgi:hypothetical protein
MHWDGVEERPAPSEDESRGNAGLELLVVLEEWKNGRLEGRKVGRLVIGVNSEW